VPAAAQQASRYDEVFKLLAKRKREILEKECFGLVEFVEPAHDFSVVGGMDEVKRELMHIANNIRDGNTNRVPMGLLFTGPMGTGKTFVAEAFAKSSGLTAIKLKNFRSKWVGSTEGNLEKILSVVKAIGNILVIIDEGDRAFGNSDGDGDGGTSSRVIARIKEFMSDTTNRGRVLFVLMTNRPDKLDIDIKRAGRLDRKIPFFYGQDADEVEPSPHGPAAAPQGGPRPGVAAGPRQTSEKLVGYSNADIEAVVLPPTTWPRAAGAASPPRSCAGHRRLPAVARHGHAGVHGAAGRVRVLEPRHAAQALRRHLARGAAGPDRGAQAAHPLRAAAPAARARPRGAGPDAEALRWRSTAHGPCPRRHEAPLGAPIGRWASSGSSRRTPRLRHLAIVIRSPPRHGGAALGGTLSVGQSASPWGTFGGR
jgi:DNA polymerase III delta prime subunit